MNTIHFYYDIVEKALAKIGLNPQTARSKHPGKWNLTKGKIPVWVDVFYSDAEKRTYFQVGAPVFRMPPNKQKEFALQLLDLNRHLFGVAFCLNKDQAYLKTLRETEGLDVNEAYEMIMRVGNYANQYRNELSNKYPSWPPNTVEPSNPQLN